MTDKVKSEKTDKEFALEVNKTKIDSQKNIVSHLETAEKSHLEKAISHEDQNHEKISGINTAAKGYTELAIEAEKERIKLQAFNK